MIDHDPIRQRFTAVSAQPDKRDRRLLAVTEACAKRYDGITAAREQPVLRSTVKRGLQELVEPALVAGRVWRPQDDGGK